MPSLCYLDLNFPAQTVTEDTTKYQIDGVPSNSTICNANIVSIIKFIQQMVREDLGKSSLELVNVTYCDGNDDGHLFRIFATVKGPTDATSSLPGNFTKALLAGSSEIMSKIGSLQADTVLAATTIQVLT